MVKQALVYETLKAAARTAAAEGHTAEAQAIFERLGRLIAEKLGTDSMEYAVCMHELADVCAEEKLWSVAEQYYRGVLEVYFRDLPETAPAIAMVLRGLAEVYRAQGNPLEAKRLEKDAAARLSSHLSE
jgi:hypothetical protein